MNTIFSDNLGTLPSPLSPPSPPPSSLSSPPLRTPSLPFSSLSLLLHHYATIACTRVPAITLGSTRVRRFVL